MPKSPNSRSPKGKDSPGRLRDGRRRGRDKERSKEKEEEEKVAIPKGEEEMVGKSLETNKKLYEEMNVRSKISNKLSNAVKKLLGEKE